VQRGKTNETGTSEWNGKRRAREAREAYQKDARLTEKETKSDER